MGLAVVRKRPGAELVALTLSGLLAGVAAGFVLSEMFGAGGPRRMSRIIRTRHAGRGRRDLLREREPLLAAVRDALAQEPVLQSEPIGVRICGEHGLELRGWVATRQARALAYRLARAASNHLDVANRLEVRDLDDEAQPARGDAPRTA